MKILVITSCTGEKAHKPDNQLTQEDFRLGREHIAKREQELKEFLTPAESLYTGMQHTRLMRGVEAARQNKIDLDLWILSAGYGLIPGDQVIAPYECTFTGMKSKELGEWADHINCPSTVRKLFSKQYDLVLVLLGDAYLRACKLTDDVTFESPTLFLGGKASAKRLPESENVQVHILGNPDTRKFSCGLVGLKGEVAARVLEAFSEGSLTIDNLLSDLDSTLESLEGTVKREKKRAGRPNPKVDKVIQIPERWWEKPHRSKLRYFIPEWNDLVDPDYDFENEIHWGGVGNWDNEVYAHQIYPDANSIDASRSKSPSRMQTVRSDNPAFRITLRDSAIRS
jgi:hypothetical protein